MDDQDLSPAQKKKSSAIVSAARLHFATHGFEATKLSEIARDAGVAVGTIYLRYTSKAELLAGVLGAVEEAFCDAIDTKKIWETPFPERFALVVEGVMKAAQGQPDLPALMALSSLAAPSNAPEKQPMLEKIAEHIQSGIVAGSLRDDVDPKLAAHMAHGMVNGAMRELMSNPDRAPKDMVHHIADAYAKWLLAP